MCFAAFPKSIGVIASRVGVCSKQHSLTERITNGTNKDRWVIAVLLLNFYMRWQVNRPIHRAATTHWCYLLIFVKRGTHPDQRTCPCSNGISAGKTKKHTTGNRRGGFCTACHDNPCTSGCENHQARARAIVGRPAR